MRYEPGPATRSERRRGRLPVSRTDNPLTPPTLDAVSDALTDPALALLEAARAAADAAGIELWAVGGALRDCAAGRPPSDLDAAIAAADPWAAGRLAGSVSDRLGRACEVTTEPRFGTASVRCAAGRLEIATLRSEHYPRPGALPVVRLGASIEEDLGRRDFTVNALALGLAGPRSGELLDPLGGLDDLSARRLRALHARSFADDATRLWRGARHAAALDLRPEPATAGWIAEGARFLAPISGRRLWAEFERTAAQRRAGRTVGLLARWGVLKGVHAGWRVPDAATRALRHRPGPHAPELLFAALLATLPERDAIAGRLTAPRDARQAAEDASRLLAMPDASPEALASREGVGSAGRTAAGWLDPARQPALQRALRRWERTRSPLDGRALGRLGVAAGPGLGAWLARLRRERYLGTLDSAADARGLVRTERARETGSGQGSR